MLKLIKSELRPTTELRLTRMMKDLLALRELSSSEQRAAYHIIEKLRDALSLILDKLDGKRV